MSSPIISVRNIGKKYKLGATLGGRNYKTLRDVLTKAAFSPFRKLSAAFRKEPSTSGSNSSPNNPITQSPNNSITQSLNNSITKPPNNPKEFWALKDISFDVNQGEVVGIIGRNGAGKSTLLKILSEITEPTEGEIRIRGLVASLLEVGTGFHPELSGRENIYMNGAILGMTKAEIKAKFDEIVAFAGVEKFIDTPVKRYSSGMYVRLAFAVAAHLEPEILIVDEVLAVGDAEFQKKCLGKMSDVAKQGRTVLFVSHNMAAVNRLCERCILLDNGRIIMDAPAVETTNKYLKADSATMAERIWEDMNSAPGDEVARLKAVRVISSEGKVSDTIDIRHPLTIEMEYWNHKEGVHLSPAFSFINEQGIILFVFADWMDPTTGQKPKPAGICCARCVVPGNIFAEGLITVVAQVCTVQPSFKVHFLEWQSVGFQVVDKNEKGSVRAGWGKNIPGVVRPMLHWENQLIGEI